MTEHETMTEHEICEKLREWFERFLDGANPFSADSFRLWLATNDYDEYGLPRIGGFLSAEGIFATEDEAKGARHDKPDCKKGRVAYNIPQFCKYASLPIKWSPLLMELFTLIGELGNIGGKEQEQ